MTPDTLDALETRDPDQRERDLMARLPQLIAHAAGARLGAHPRRVLLDDILDEGETLVQVKRRLLEMGATEVAIAEFADKAHQRTQPGRALASSYRNG
jgi:predicted amidophosphoribosyltransferase